MLKTIKDKVKQRIVSDYKALFSDSADVMDESKLKDAVRRILEEIVQHEHMNLSDADKKTIISDLVNEFIGFGPVEELLKDPAITEIMINGPKSIYVEKAGIKEPASITFDNEEQLMHIVHKILAPTRRRVDESYPYTDISLKDGSRVNIIIAPLALDGPVITIRKFSGLIKTMDDLVGLDTMDRKVGDFLVACIKAEVNIIFSGATGVGKTTTLNVLSSYIGNNERIITIEDTSELNLNQAHVVRLEARQPNIEGKGEVSIRELFKNSLRMRPDRIIIGEIRGAEALDMLQAICSGHKGSLAILHANSPQDVIYRIETMILTSGLPINLDIIHRQIAASINLIVHQEQLLDGSRKIIRVTQVNGLKDGKVVLEDIFVYDMENRDIGKGWKATGIIPVFYPLFKQAGVSLSREIFNKD